MADIEHKANVFKEHIHRFKKPWCISFTLYFIGVIVILGGLGVIISIFIGDDIKGISSNLSTYSIALLAPAIISILLSAVRSHFQVSWSIVSTLVLLFAAFLLFLSFGNNGVVSLMSSMLSTIIAWGYWIIANYDNVFLNDEAYHKKIATETQENHGANW